MASRIDRHIGGKHDIFADCYLCHIQDNTVEIRIEIISGFNVGSIITAERRLHKDILTRFSEDLTDQRIFLFFRLRRQIVIAVNPFSALLPLLLESILPRLIWQFA